MTVSGYSPRTSTVSPRNSIVSVNGCRSPRNSQASIPGKLENGTCNGSLDSEAYFVEEMNSIDGSMGWEKASLQSSVMSIDDWERSSMQNNYDPYSDASEPGSPGSEPTSPRSTRVALFKGPHYDEMKQLTRTISEQTVKDQVTLADTAPYLTLGIIALAFLVAALCGAFAFLLHVAVKAAGCGTGINGCHYSFLLDTLEPYGISRPLLMVITAFVTGGICSFVMFGPLKSLSKIGKKCRGGGIAGSKIVIGAGHSVNGWVPPLRIFLAAIYLGGGNPLGTEGPIIHASSSLATFQLRLAGITQPKLLSMFAVVGAAAGLSAGFKVVITGFVFTIEELTRSLTQRTALIITLAAAVAMAVREQLVDFMHHYVDLGHKELVPHPDNWKKLSRVDLYWLIALCIPIGVLTGCVGWVFNRCTWYVQAIINPRMVHKKMSRWHALLLPEASHLALIGLITACIGGVVYEISGVNSVWGTTAGAIPETLEKGLGWEKALVMFIGKFIATTLATAGGGPGGVLVPSLAAGGLVGIIVGRIAGLNEQSVASCAVLGMGSLLASVMHLPVTGVILIFELTWAKELLVHIILANFIAANVALRLPHGRHTFMHQCLEHDRVWQRLRGQDFIETDDQARIALFNQGVGKITAMTTFALKWWLLTDQERMRLVFQGWRQRSQRTGKLIRMELQAMTNHHKKYLAMFLQSHDQSLMRVGYSAFYSNWLRSKAEQRQLSPEVPATPLPREPTPTKKKMFIDSHATRLEAIIRNDDLEQGLVAPGKIVIHIPEEKSLHSRQVSI